MSKTVFTCQQMRDRIAARHPGIKLIKFTVWHTAAKILKLKPSLQAAPTAAQAAKGGAGAIQFYSGAQEKKIEAEILRRRWIQLHAERRRKAAKPKTTRRSTFAAR